MSDYRDTLERLAAVNPVPSGSFSNAAETDQAKTLLARILATEPEIHRTRHERVPHRLIVSVAGVALLVLAFFVWGPFGSEAPQQASAAQALREAASVAASQSADRSGDVAF